MYKFWIICEFKNFFIAICIIILPIRKWNLSLRNSLRMAVNERLYMPHRYTRFLYRKNNRLLHKDFVPLNLTHTFSVLYISSKKYSCIQSFNKTSICILYKKWFLYSVHVCFFISRQEFVDAYVDYIFNKSVASLFDAFHAGFHKVCGGKVLQLFQPNELQAMVIGNTNYDWKELEKVGENKSLILFKWKGKRKTWLVDGNLALSFIIFHFTLFSTIVFIGKHCTLLTPQWMNFNYMN